MKKGQKLKNGYFLDLKSAKIHQNLVKMMVLLYTSLKVQLVRPFFFFFLKKKIKIRKKNSEFFKKGQKMKNGYFLDPKSAKIS